jgi:hypothetical protein
VQRAGCDTQKYPFVSPLTLFDEVETLLGHWGDSVVTADVGCNTVRLQRDHPTAFWNCIWYFHRCSLPTSFLVADFICANMSENVAGQPAVDCADAILGASAIDRALLSASAALIEKNLRKGSKSGE